MSEWQWLGPVIGVVVGAALAAWRRNRRRRSLIEQVLLAVVGGAVAVVVWLVIDVAFEPGAAAVARVVVGCAALALVAFLLVRHRGPDGTTS